MPSHPVYGGDPTTLPAMPATRRPTSGDHSSLTAREKADRILRTILNSEGPILLVVPGTDSTPYEHANLNAARRFIERTKGPAVVASIPYDNTTGRAIQRFLGVGQALGNDVLSLVLRELSRRQPGRPVHIVSESQGSWVVADVLRDPRAAANVQRVAMFSKPGFISVPAALRGKLGHAQAGKGAGMISEPRVVEFQHTDDIVPGLFSALNGARISSLLLSLGKMLVTGDWKYHPHSYDEDGASAGEFLATGAAPNDRVHSSSHDR